MFGSFYYKFFKARFLNRVLLLYIAITVFTLAILSFIIISNVSRILIDKEIKSNEILLYNIDNYITQKDKMTKTILRQAFMEKSFIPDVFYFLQNNPEKLSAEYLKTKPSFDNYFSSLFSRDPDITGISVYKPADGHIYQYSKLVTATYTDVEAPYSEKIKTIENNSYPRIRIYPASQPLYITSDNAPVYTMGINIKALNSNKNTGVLLIDFDTSGITDILSRFSPDYSGNILVLLKNGSVVFDSSGEFYGREYPYMDMLDSKSGEVKIEDQSYIINSLESSGTETMIASIIPKNAIIENLKNIQYSIITASALCILVCLTLMVLSSRVFSKRISIIRSAMKEIREGNLKKRIQISNPEDELGQVVVSFNKMSEHLQDYIEKVYVSEIRQKDAELKQKQAHITVLQSQINPHFLYNTLEAIRMKAAMDGNHDVGNMICILAKLFRNVVRQKTIISVEDEIRYCEMYLTLFKIRYGEKFNYEASIEKGILECRTINHLLQPILENYTIHGFDPEKAENRLEIRGFQKEGELNFIIEDNGRGISPERLLEIKKQLKDPVMAKDKNIGLSNVNERIRIIFGEEYGLDIESESGKYTRVIVRIPAEMKEERDNVQSIAGG